MVATQVEREATAKKIAEQAVAQGMDPVAAERLAREQVGLPLLRPAPGPGSKSKPAKKPPAPRRKPAGRSRRRRARKVGRVVAFPGGRVSSVGALMAQSLGLVALYWLLRNATSIATVTRLVSRGLAWFFTPPGVQSAVSK